MGIRDSRGREGGGDMSCSSHLQRRAGRRCKEQRSFASLRSHREGQRAVCVCQEAGGDWPGWQAARNPLLPSPLQVCGKSFNRMYNLLGHMHLHAGSKPFKCPYCSSKFNLKGNLSRHMKVKHGVMDISLDSQGGWAVRSGQNRSDSGMAHSVGRLAKAETSLRWAQVWREGEPGEPSWQ